MKTGAGAALVLAIALHATGFAAIKTYEVVPCSNYVAATPPDGEVTQYFRNTVDSLMVAGSWLLVEGSVGDAVGPGGCAGDAAA